MGGVFFGRGDRLIVAYYLSNETLGVYSAITDTASTIVNFASLPVQPILPLLSNHSLNTNDADKSTKKLKQQIKQSIEANALIALGSATWLFILAPMIAHFLFTNAANETSIAALRIAIVIYAFVSLYTVGFFTLLSLNVYSCMFIYWTSAIFALILIRSGAINFNLLGAIIGNIGFIFSWLMLVFAMKKLHLPRWFWLRCSLLPILLFIASIFISILVKNNLALGIIIGIIESVILLLWFISNQKINFNFIIHRLFS
jgi:O-antigen/teichoic acid export membrane protein